ncbi:hypothetical protein HMPREF9554_00115 [Treponema phagedenis F0421]|nr:hypothetical protein HMPREF9554_00115 [Treponema phagedenis F0421]
MVSLLTVAPCRTLFYKIILICIKCIKKNKSGYQKNVIVVSKKRG